jgi:hypothetical protein
VPAIVSGTFAQPKFAPDAEQMAKLKLTGLFGAGGSGVNGLINSLTGRPANSNAAPGNATPEGASPQGTVNDLLNRFRKKKDEKKD